MCIFFSYMWITERIVMFMKAMEYILKDLSSRINYDELGNVYIDTACLSWFEDEFLIYMGISWHQGDDFIFISKEYCDKYNEYEIIVPDGLEYDGSVRKPYYRMRGKPVTEDLNLFEEPIISLQVSKKSVVVMILYLLLTSIIG